MITELAFPPRRSPIAQYASAERGDVRSDVDIPVVDPDLYRVYLPITHTALGAGAEGQVGADWCADWETYCDTLKGFRPRHSSVGVLSSYTSSVCALNHYITSIHREQLDWYLGLVDGRPRTWFRSKHTTRVIPAPRVDEYTTRLRSILNRMPSCDLYVTGGGGDGEARAWSTFVAVYSHSRKGSSVLIRMPTWELDERLLWSMAELYTRVVVKCCDCAPEIVVMGESLVTNPTKTTTRALSTFRGFTEKPPGFESVCRVLEDVRIAITGTAERLSKGDPVARWTREYPIPPINSGNHLLDPGHKEDVGRAVAEMPEFDNAPDLTSVLGV